MITAIVRAEGAELLVPLRTGGCRLALRMAAIVASAWLAVAPQDARAAGREDFLIDTTADLADLCGAKPGDENYVAAIHMCQGYLLGVHHFYTAVSAELRTGVYCAESVTPTPTRDQIMTAFAAWVGQNPQVAQTEALDGLLTWAAETFPCRGSAQMGGMGQ